MKIRIQIPALFFYGISTFMLAMCIIYLVSAFAWINKSFAGFLIYRDAYVATMGSRDWPGAKAGIRTLERIVAIDGQPVTEGRQVVKTLTHKTPGTLVRYGVESNGNVREVIVPVVKFGVKDFCLVFLVPYVGGLALLTLGIIVYLLKPNVSVSWVFFALCFSVGGYMVASFDAQTSHLFARLEYLTMCLFPATFLHLGLVFPDKKRFLDRAPALEYLIYLPALILAIAFQIYLFIFQNVLSSGSLSWFPTYKELGSITRVFSLICALSLLVLVFHSLYKAPTIVARQRARMIIFGVAMSFIPCGIIMLVVFTMGVTFPWNFLVFFVIFFPASIAYSIVTHNLFDADEIIRRTVGYVVVTAVVIGVYVGVSVVLNVLLGQYQLSQSRAFPILFTLGVILVFNPLRDRIQALVDRIFFRKEYDYGTIVEKVGEAMTSLLDLPEILKRLTQTFVEDMFVNTGSVMLLSHAGAEYKVYLAEGEKKEDVEKKIIKKDNPLIQIIEKEKRELTQYDFLEDPKFREVSAPCVAEFEALNASLMVPLVYQNQVIGSLNLGEKKSGKAFNREDIDLLHTLAHQGAVAIENARLFQENLEKQRMEEELNIARDLQMSMLPATCPEIKGFRIAASSTPAREVGGDFYDFIEMGEDKAGMVIADVTGKSVSGALVMSSSRSVFRMLSEEELSVSESMMRANRRLKKDIKTGMFVALLFAVLNSADRTLTLCSAGQTQPIHLSTKTGEAKLVDTEGDTFPLGILEEASYEETGLQLEPGDRVIFYTDGIVEAMNEQEEMFGFERLIKVVKNAKSMNADSLLKEILNMVNEFAGGAKQHDDLTIIVVSVEE